MCAERPLRPAGSVSKVYRSRWHTHVARNLIDASANEPSEAVEVLREVHASKVATVEDTDSPEAIRGETKAASACPHVHYKLTIRYDGALAVRRHPSPRTAVGGKDALVCCPEHASVLHADYFRT